MIFTTNYNTVETKPYDTFVCEKKHFNLSKSGITFDYDGLITFIKYSDIKSIWTTVDNVFWGSWLIKKPKATRCDCDDYYRLGITVANTKYKICYGSIYRVFTQPKDSANGTEKNEKENEKEKQELLKEIKKDFDRIKGKM